MSIFFNNSSINDWFFSTDNIIKVYRNNAICYYKIDSSSPSGQTPCFAVVDNISQYSDTEFEDVFNKADNKWYKLNNLNQYEEYGVYGSGRTSCEGSTSRLPQGYTEVEYIRQNSNYNAYINTGVIIFDNTTNTYTITTKLASEFHSNLGCATIINCERVNSPYDGLGYRYKCTSTVNQLEFFGGHPNYTSSVVDNGDGTKTVTFQSSGNSSFTTDVPLSYMAAFSSTTYGANAGWRYSDTTIYSSTIVKNGITVRDFVPAKRDSDSVYGLYDLINDVFYTSPNGNNFIGGEPITPTDCVTTYNGKLTIDDGYEYQYSGGSWVNVGAVITQSYRYWMWRSVGDIVGNPTNYIQFSEFDLSVNGSDVSLSYISAAPTGVTNETADKLFDNSTSTKYCANFSSYLATNYVLFDSTNAIVPTSFAMTTANDSASTGRYPKNWVLLGSNTSTTNWNDGSWDTVVSGTCGNEMKVNYKRFNYPISGMEEYPVYYTEIQDPPNNLTFSSMTEAEAYECPWVGMVATIDGAPYVFSGDSTSGYEWVEKLTAWYTLQDLINTHTVVSIGNNKYRFDPTVNGISYFRVHTDKVSGSGTFVDLYNDNLPSPPYFGIKDDSEINLYQSVDGYRNLKSAADSSTCTWAYWIDANTIEVNAQAIMNDTMKIGFYTGSFSKLLLSFELPTV